MTATQWVAGAAGGTPITADHLNAMITDTTTAQSRADAAHDLAQTNGPGTPGADGASAYQVALNGGFVGTEAQWLASLVGPKGTTGDAGSVGQTGQTGADGASAYQVAVAGGYVGTQAQWLASLVGAQGPKGDTGATGAAGTPGTTGSQGPAGPNLFRMIIWNSTAWPTRVSIDPGSTMNLLYVGGTVGPTDAINNQDVWVKDLA